MKKPWIALLLALVLGLTCFAPVLADEPAISNEVVVRAADPLPVNPVLALSLALTPDQTTAGGSLVATVTLSNTGAPVRGQQQSLLLPVGVNPAFPDLLDYDATSRLIKWTSDLLTDQTISQAIDLVVADNALAHTSYTLRAAAGALTADAILTVVDSSLQLAMSSTVRWAEPGDAVHYSVKLTNTGLSDVNGLTVVNQVPTGMTVDPRTISGGGVYAGNAITWVVNVPAGGVTRLEFLGTIPAYAVEGDVFVNTVSAGGLTATASVSVHEPEPLLRISKKVNNRTPAPGTTVRYTIRVANDGGADAYDVRIIDTLPLDLEIDRDSISGYGSYESRARRIVWDVDVPAFDAITLTFRAYVPDWTEDGDVYVNRAHISGGKTAKATLTVTEDAVPKTGLDYVAPAPLSIAPVSTDDPPAAVLDIVEVALPPVDAAFVALYETNPNLVGWLKVADQVDQPIAQADNNDFYMIRGFDGQESEAGALFLDERNHLIPRDQHLLIYGHNMKSDAMFGRLQDFRALDYLKANPTFTFQSIYEAAPTTYAIVAVLDASMDVGNKDYLKIRRPNFDDEAEALAFWAEMAAFNYFDIPVDVAATDALLSLVTCSYLQDNGRLLVVGRPLREGETAESIAALMAGAKAK